MQYEQLVSHAHTLMTDARRLHYLITTEPFPEMYESASSVEQRAVINRIEHQDYDGVKYWMAHQRQKDFDRMTVRDLRKVAQQRRIPDYHFMNREELIVELTNDSERRTSVT